MEMGTHIFFDMTQLPDQFGLPLDAARRFQQGTGQGTEGLMGDSVE